jgi:hypothetical protein
MPHVQEENEQGKLLEKDSRKGRRVLYLLDVANETLYGTIQTVVRFSYGDVFLVQIQPGRHITTEAEHFFLLEKKTPEWHAGDRVRFQRDNGGFLEGIVLHPLIFNGELRILVRFDDGQTFTLHPERLKKSGTS